MTQLHMYTFQGQSAIGNRRDVDVRCHMLNFRPPLLSPWRGAEPGVRDDRCRARTVATAATVDTVDVLTLLVPVPPALALNSPSVRFVLSPPSPAPASLALVFPSVPPRFLLLPARLLPVRLPVRLVLRLPSSLGLPGGVPGGGWGGDGGCGGWGG